MKCTCSCQKILRKRGKMASMLRSMNSVPRMHGSDKLSEKRKRSKMRTPWCVNIHVYGVLGEEAIVCCVSDTR